MPRRNLRSPAAGEDLLSYISRLDLWDTIRDLARFAEQRKDLGRNDNYRFPQPFQKINKAINDTGDDCLECFEVVCYDRPFCPPDEDKPDSLDSFKTNPLFFAKKVGEDKCCIAVFQTPVADGDCAEIITHGRTRVQVDIQDAEDECACGIEGETLCLMSTNEQPAPARIIWRERPGETGKMWCEVDIMGCPCGLCNPPVVTCRFEREAVFDPQTEEDMIQEFLVYTVQNATLAELERECNGEVSRSQLVLDENGNAAGRFQTTPEFTDCCWVIRAENDCGVTSEQCCQRDGDPCCPGCMCEYELPEDYDPNDPERPPSLTVPGHPVGDPSQPMDIDLVDPHNTFCCAEAGTRGLAIRGCDNVYYAITADCICKPKVNCEIDPCGDKVRYKIHKVDEAWYTQECGSVPERIDLPVEDCCDGSKFVTGEIDRDPCCKYVFYGKLNQCEVSKECCGEPPSIDCTVERIDDENARFFIDYREACQVYVVETCNGVETRRDFVTGEVPCDTVEIELPVNCDCRYHVELLNPCLDEPLIQVCQVPGCQPCGQFNCCDALLGMWMNISGVVNDGICDCSLLNTIGTVFVPLQYDENQPGISRRCGGSLDVLVIGCNGTPVTVSFSWKLENGIVVTGSVGLDPFIGELLSFSREICANDCSECAGLLTVSGNDSIPGGGGPGLQSSCDFSQAVLNLVPDVFCV